MMQEGQERLIRVIAAIQSGRSDWHLELRGWDGLDPSLTFLRQDYGRDLRFIDLSFPYLEPSEVGGSLLFKEGRLDLTGADLSGTLLTRANLEGACLDRANLSMTELTYANLNRTHSKDAVFEGSEMMACIMNGVRYERCRLSAAELSYADLRNSMFYYCDFTGANLTEAHLGHSQFNACDFSRTHALRCFLEEAGFSNCTIEGANFKRTPFSQAKFYNCSIKDSDLSYCNFTRYDFRQRFNSEFGRASFKYAVLEKCTLPETFRLSRVEFHGTLIRDTFVSRESFRENGDHPAIREEREGSLENARFTYSMLKNNWSGLGMNSQAAWASVREKEMERFMLRKRISSGQYKNSTDRISAWPRYLGFSYFRLLFDYGENPWRLFLWAFVWILVCGVLYGILGVTDGDSLVSFSSGRNPVDFLYFSVITFTTVGYGDLTPGSLASEIVALIQGFSGVFTSGLFIWSLGKRVSSR
jgi:uncharacterized protein YjbI with pentapeptide repeats